MYKNFSVLPKKLPTGSFPGRPVKKRPAARTGKSANTQPRKVGYPHFNISCFWRGNVVSLQRQGGSAGFPAFVLGDFLYGAGRKRPFSGKNARSAFAKTITSRRKSTTSRQESITWSCAEAPPKRCGKLNMLKSEGPHGPPAKGGKRAAAATGGSDYLSHRVTPWRTDSCHLGQKC